VNRSGPSRSLNDLLQGVPGRSNNSPGAVTGNRPGTSGRSPGSASGSRPRDFDNARSGSGNRPDFDRDRDNDRGGRDRNDWNRNDWNRNDWNRNNWDRDRNDWNRNDWNRNNNWSNWSRNLGRYVTPGYRPYGNGSYWNRYYGNRYYGYGYPGYGVGFGGIGIPGIGLGYGLSGLFGSGYYGNRYGTYYPGYYTGDYIGNYTTGYRGTYTEPDTAVITEEVAVNQDYLVSARSAFMEGDYATAQRLVNHAIVDAPDNPKAHELMSLALLAQGEYAGAAAAGHAAASLAPVADWPTLYRYYNDRDRYESHFNALKQFANENPDVPDGHFLLGLHHMMMGHQESAQKQFGEYLRTVNYADEVGVKLYGEAGGDVAALPRPEPPQATAPQAVTPPATAPQAVAPSDGNATTPVP
jgi:hypothetical protein